MKLKRFGSDFFNNKNIVESPQLFVATPSDYRLGPGDEINHKFIWMPLKLLILFRFQEMEMLNLIKLAPVYLSGLSIKSASKRLKFKDCLKTIYWS